MMLNETYRAMLAHKSVIRETFMYGKQRAAEIGYENVFDYSLGNPSVPCPPRFTAAMQDLLPQPGRPGVPHRRGSPSGQNVRPAL